MGAIKVTDIPRYSYDDYKLWEGKWELIDGYPYAMAPAPMIRHQKISNKIAWQLENVLSDCKYCYAVLPIDWKIDTNTVVQPDNSIICQEPFDGAYITKAPLVIFEILSKSTSKKDVGIKFDLYEKEGVKYYIIVDPDENIAKVYHLQNGLYIKQGDIKDETVVFNLDPCEKDLEFDFSKIW